MVEAHGATGDFVLAQRLPGAANWHPRQTMLDVQHQQHHQQQNDIDEDEFQIRVKGQVEELMERHAALFGSPPKLQPEKRRRRGGDTVRPAGKGQPVVQHQANDLPEAEGHNRQIVTVHAQHREAKYRPGRGGHQRRQRQHGPEA